MVSSPPHSGRASATCAVGRRRSIAARRRSSSAYRAGPRPGGWGESPMRHLAKVFECKWEALNVALAVGVAAVVVALFFVFNALHWEHYWLSATFGLVFMIVGAARGHYAHRARDLAVL